MGTIVVLKEVTKKDKNKNNTMRINISRFKWVKDGDVKSRQLVPNSTNTITCWFNESNKYKEEIKSKWNEIFSPTSNGVANAINSFLSLTGLGSLQSKSMYTQIWTGTEPLDFNFTEMLFLAENNATEDVMLPIRKLQAMCLPIEQPNANNENAFTNQNGWKQFQAEHPDKAKKALDIYNDIANSLWRTILLPPSSSVINIKQELMGKEFEAISSIEIGNFIILRDVILENVGVTWDINNVDYTGAPIKANVTLKLKSRTIWTDKTIENLLNGRTDVNRFDDQGRELPTVLDFAGIVSNIWDVLTSKEGEKK